MAYDIDTWDLTGESLVWVRVPRLPPEGTDILLYCGSAGTLKASDVWTPHYAAVWHLNEDGMDATGYNLAWKTQNGPTIVANNKLLGRGVSIGSSDKGMHMDNPAEYVLSPAHLTVSGWYCPVDNNIGTSRLISWKSSSGNTTGFEFIFHANQFLMVRGSGGTGSATPQYSFSWKKEVWYHLAAIYDGTTGTAYTNGIPLELVSGKTNVIPETKAGTSSVGFGNMGGTAEYSYAFRGNLDELRF